MGIPISEEGVKALKDAQAQEASRQYLSYSVSRNRYVPCGSCHNRTRLTPCPVCNPPAVSCVATAAPEVVKRGTLIALTSPAMASGKSEVAKVLMGRGFEPVKFAAGLKAMTRAFLGQLGYDDPYVIEQMVEGDLKQVTIESIGVTPRHLMQTIGTEWRLTVREDLWAKMVEVKVDAMLAKGISVVIDDMRFPVELDAVKRLGGHSVRVIRPGTEPINGHSSEGQLAPIEMPEIVNDGTLLRLRARTLDLVDTLTA